MSSMIPDYDIFKNGLLRLLIWQRGSLKDFSGNDGAATPTDCVLTDLGIKTNGSSSNVNITGLTLPSDSPLTIAFYLRSTQTGTFKYLFSSATGLWGFAWGGGTSGYLAHNDGVATHNFGASPKDNKSHSVVFTLSGDGVTSRCYVDGESVGIDYAYSAKAIGSTVRLFSLYSGASFYFSGDTQYVSIASHFCTDTDAYQYHAAFTEMARLETPPTRSFISPSIEPNPSEEGLVFASNMRTVGSVLPNLGTGDNGVIVGARHSKDALGDFLYFDGSAGSGVSLPNMAVPSTSPLVFSTWFYLSEAVTSQINFFDSLTGRFTFLINGSGVVQFYDGGAFRTTGVTPTAAEIHNAVFVLDPDNTRFWFALDGNAVGPFTYTPIAIGSTTVLGSRYDKTLNVFKGKIYAPKILTTLPNDPANYAKREYKKGLYALMQAGYGVRESVAAITAGFIENTDIEVSSGSVKVIGEFDANDDHLKVIEAQAISTIRFPVTNLGDEDENRFAWYDSGSGYIWSELNLSDRYFLMASGDKFIYSSLRGKSNMIKRLLSE